MSVEMRSPRRRDRIGGRERKKKEAETKCMTKPGLANW